MTQKDTDISRVLALVHDLDDPDLVGAIKRVCSQAAVAASMRRALESQTDHKIEALAAQMFAAGAGNIINPSDLPELARRCRHAARIFYSPEGS